MIKLSILLSTINDRIFNTTELLSRQFENTEWIIVHQVTDLSKADQYRAFYEQYASPTYQFFPLYAKGTGISRNTAMAKASGELFYLCDDDLVLMPNFQDIIIENTNHFPNIGIFTFQITTPEGQPFKNYPQATYQHSLRSTAKVSIVEMVIRKSAYDTGHIKFDERFGLATLYNTGEEFVMLTDALKNGIKAQYIPEVLVQHPPISSGKIFNAEVAFDKGAMTARVYGWKFIVIDTLFAIRKYTTYRHSIGFFSFMIQMFKGSMHFLKND